MAFLDVHFRSETLAKAVGMHVLLPDQGEPPFPVLYLLHGLSDDYTAWHRRTSIERYADAWPLIVVMPDGYRGFYTDNAAGPAYARYLVEEVPAFVERHFPARRGGAAQKARCIGGLSMGGYGALLTALTHPERYSSATCHSGALLYGHQETPREGSPMDLDEYRRVFGAAPTGSDHDLLAVAARAKAAGALLPKIRMDCGTEDDILDQSRAAHEHFTRLGLPHEYKEFTGVHDWAYWDARIQEALPFHAAALGIQRLD